VGEGDVPQLLDVFAGEVIETLSGLTGIFADGELVSRDSIREDVVFHDLLLLTGTVAQVFLTLLDMLHSVKHLSLGRGQGQKDGEDGGHPLARSGQVGDQNQTD